VSAELRRQSADVRHEFVGRDAACPVGARRAPSRARPITAAQDTELARWQAQVFEFDLLDVRQAGVRTGTVWPPGSTGSTGSTGNDAIDAKRSVVVEGAKGHEIGQVLTATLRALGVDARYLVRGVLDWQAQGRPIEPLAAAADDG
jgi:rhodanese-related sulfurtransferase